MWECVRVLQCGEHMSYACASECACMPWVCTSGVKGCQGDIFYSIPTCWEDLERRAMQCSCSACCWRVCSQRKVGFLIKISKLFSNSQVLTTTESEKELYHPQCYNQSLWNFITEGGGGGEAGAGGGARVWGRGWQWG